MGLMLSGKRPMSAPCASELARAVVHGNYVPRSCTKTLSCEAQNLISIMLQRNPCDRRTPAELLRHAWFRLEKGRREAELDINICSELATIQAETHFKKAMMRMIASMVPASQIQELTSTFMAMDTNCDGVVTFKEFKAALAVHPELLRLCGPDLQRIFSEIDHDGSGGVTIHEFVAATLYSQKVMMNNVLLDAFQALDVNDDGRLNRDELNLMIKEAEQKLGPEQGAEMRRRIAGDVSRTMEFVEFVDLMNEEGGQKSPMEQNDIGFLGLQCCCRQTMDVRRRKARADLAVSPNANFKPQLPGPLEFRV